MMYQVRCGYETRHPVTDESKVDAIAASLEANGWIGAPVVIWDGGTLQAVTGVHRLAACERIGMMPETVTLAEVFAAADLDLSAIEADENYDLLSILSYLPADVAEQYGIEL